MIDCPNTEVRDLLPELMLGGGALTPERRELARAHLATCPACREELALLEAVRGAYARPPVIDVARVSAALPRPGAARARGTGGHAWQRAAAVALVVIGASSLWVAKDAFDRTAGEGRVDTVFGSRLLAETPALPLGDRLSEMSAQDLEALLAALEGLDALPAEDPAPVIAPLGGEEGP